VLRAFFPRQAFFLESHGAHVAQCRVEPLAVVERQPIHNFVLRLPPRCKAHLVEPFDLDLAGQRSLTALSKQSSLRLIGPFMPKATK